MSVRPMQRIVRSVPFRHKECALFENLSGVQMDLLQTKEYCLQAIIEQGKRHPDRLILEALCAAAIVRYGRSFGRGIRKSVQQSIVDQLTEIQAAAHDAFKVHRNKWIAHAVNSFDECEARAWLRPLEHGVPMQVENINILSTRTVFLGVKDMESLIDLCNGILEILGPILDSEKRRLLALARTQPAADFYAMEG